VNSEETPEYKTTEAADNDNTNENAEKSPENKAPRMEANMSPFSKVFKMPEPKCNKGRSIKRDILPKAITGEEFRAILMEKRKSENR